MTVYEFIEDKINRYKNYFHSSEPKIAVIYSDSNDYERLRNKFKDYNNYIIYGNEVNYFIGQNLVGVITSINTDSSYQYILDRVIAIIYSRTCNKEDRICIQNI